MWPGVRGAGYRFHFHEPGSPAAEPTAGHTLVLGRTGSGKTLAAGFLAAQARRAGARVIAFDKDHGLEMALRAMGGRYATIRAGHPTGLAPLMTETDARGRAWLADWLATLAERAAPLSAEQTRALTRAVAQNAAVGPELRRFEHFVTLFAAFDDGDDLEGRLGEWAPGGRYGWVFGHEAGDDPAGSGADPAALQGDILGFDMTEVLALAAERTAVLAYLFRRIERLLGGFYFEVRRASLVSGLHGGPHALLVCSPWSRGAPEDPSPARGEGPRHKDRGRAWPSPLDHPPRDSAQLVARCRGAAGRGVLAADRAGPRRAPTLREGKARAAR